MRRITGHVFPRRLEPPLPTAVKAKGMWIIDNEGRRYLDASGGAIVINVGHGREEIARAVYDQIMQCEYAHPTMFTSSPVEQLAEALSSHAPPGVERFYFLSGGSEAVETAIKLARTIHLESGRPHRTHLIARWNSYHGVTLGSLSAMGRTSFRVPYSPLLTNVAHIPAPYCLRCPYGLSHPNCGIQCAFALEKEIQNLGSETVSAFLVETISGGSLAAVVPPPGYFSSIREICDRYEVLLILDEVMCGMGRSGRWFASEHFDVIPDIVTLGKGLAGGAIALSAVGVRTEHFNTIRDGSGVFVHGGTFTHHSVACAGGLAVVRILERENLVERAARSGEVLGEKFESQLARHPHVGDIRGRGLLWGIELVENKETLKPFPRTGKVAERLCKNLFQMGVLVYRSTGFAGGDGDALLIGPPFIIREEEMDLLVDAIDQTLKEVLG